MLAAVPAKKTTAKSSAIPKRPQPHGGALNVGGTPGNKGGGRPPGPLKDFLATLRRDPSFHLELERAAKDREAKGFSAALKLITDYDDDKPAEKKEIAGKLEVTVKMSREGARRTAG